MNIVKSIIAGQIWCTLSCRPTWKVLRMWAYPNPGAWWTKQNSFCCFWTERRVSLCFWMACLEIIYKRLSGSRSVNCFLNEGHRSNLISSLAGSLFEEQGTFKDNKVFWNVNSRFSFCCMTELRTSVIESTCSCNKGNSSVGVSVPEEIICEDDSEIISND